MTWGNPGGLWRLSESGGAVESIASADFVRGIAVDGAHVFWAADLDHPSILAVPIGGGMTTLVASASFDPTAIAVDDRNVYWAESGGVWRAPKTGGTPIAVATGISTPQQLAVDEHCVYWAGDSIAGAPK
jgi:hypothetical protein